MQNANKDNLVPPLWKLILICMTASFCALLPADVIPQMAAYFKVFPDQAEGVLSWFLLGYGLGPLLYGPIANRYGRRKTLVFGFSLALLANIGSIIGIFCHSLISLEILRLVEGVGTSVGVVVGMMMIADTSSGAASRRIFSFIVLFLAFAPSIAMAVGGALAQFLGFQSIFMVMCAMMVVWILLALSLTETYQGPSVSIRIHRTVQRYAHMLISFSFMRFVMVATVATAVMYLFNGLGPIIAVGQLHVSSVTYGELSVIPSLGLFVGALLSLKLIQGFSAMHLMVLGLGIMTFAGLLMLLAFACHIIALWTLFSPAVLLFLGAAIVVPNASMSAISFAKDSAIGSSVMNALILMLSSAVLSSGNGMMQQFHGIVLPISLVVLVCIGFLMLVGMSFETS